MLCVKCSYQLIVWQIYIVEFLGFKSPNKSKHKQREGKYFFPEKLLFLRGSTDLNSPKSAPKLFTVSSILL